MRAIRGAITVEKNSEGEIIIATKDLLTEIMDSNNINKEEIISIL
ncbi:MAG: chorismate mutase, partial [Halanaerobiaceae bacterium]